MSFASLRTSLNSIAEIAIKLNKLGDGMHETMRQVEQFLEATNLGIPAAIKLGVDEDPDAGIISTTWLEYTRWNGRFRFVIHVNDGETLTRPWTECTRETKLMAFEALPELLAEIKNNAEAIYQKRQSISEAIMQALKKDQPLSENVVTPRQGKVELSGRMAACQGDQPLEGSMVVTPQPVTIEAVGKIEPFSFSRKKSKVKVTKIGEPIEGGDNEQS